MDISLCKDDELNSRKNIFLKTFPHDIRPIIEPNKIIGNKFIPSKDSIFISDPNVKGRLKVRIISAQNLMIEDVCTQSSDPYIKLKSSSVESFQATKVINRNLNPIWDETVFIDIENVNDEILIFDVYDHDLVGSDDLLGFVGINLSLLPYDLEIETIENLSYAKHGTIKISLTAMNFGLTNLPQNYKKDYINWRNGLKGLQKNDFTQKLKEGPYNGKITHQDFKIYNGHIKRKETKGDVALKIVSYPVLLPIIAFSDINK
ncbi:hypothetical protein RB653_006903 [Dictyostelium firmibasis]|uniref:C2 domain-containing protein n=1 Tax=Dictyostelium firmibasis TaxID=79012 RepID=A0AAN7TMT8_9MYCE